MGARAAHAVKAIDIVIAKARLRLETVIRSTILSVVPP
jgi:hypothetical protein